MKPRTELARGSLFLVGLAVLAASGCSDDDDHPIVPGGSACLDCHSDQARLEATADPEEGPGEEDPGEG